jgi:hypothetical protein
MVRVAGGIFGTELCIRDKTLLVVRWAKRVHGWKAKTDDSEPLCLQRGKWSQLTGGNS